MVQGHRTTSHQEAEKTAMIWMSLDRSQIARPLQNQPLLRSPFSLSPPVQTHLAARKTMGKVPNPHSARKAKRSRQWKYMIAMSQMRSPSLKRLVENASVLPVSLPEQDQRRPDRVTEEQRVVVMVLLLRHLKPLLRARQGRTLPPLIPIHSIIMVTLFALFAHLQHRLTMPRKYTNRDMTP